MPVSKFRFILITSLGAIVMFGCGTMEKAGRTRAAADFSCPEEDIQLTYAAGELNSKEYNVTGCGKSDYYSVRCNIFGSCTVRNRAEIDEHNKEVEEDLRRMRGCHNNATCIEHHGDGYVCIDYTCVKQ